MTAGPVRFGRRRSRRLTAGLPGCRRLGTPNGGPVRLDQLFVPFSSTAGRCGRMQAPAWAPGSVGSAYGRRPSDAESLLSGQDWQRMLESSGPGGVGHPFPAGSGRRDRSSRGLPPPARPAGPRHRRSPPQRGPVPAPLHPGQRGQRAEVGDGLPGRRLHRGGHPGGRHLRGPGAPQLGSLPRLPGDGGHGEHRQRGGRRPRHGRRRPVRAGAVGRRHPGNWMPLAERSSSLVVRQFFYDWSEEVRRRPVHRVHRPARPGLGLRPCPPR